MPSVVAKSETRRQPRAPCSSEEKNSAALVALALGVWETVETVPYVGIARGNSQRRGDTREAKLSTKCQTGELPRVRHWQPGGTGGVGRRERERERECVCVCVRESLHARARLNNEHSTQAREGFALRASDTVMFWYGVLLPRPSAQPERALHWALHSGLYEHNKSDDHMSATDCGHSPAAPRARCTNVVGPGLSLYNVNFVHNLKLCGRNGYPNRPNRLGGTDTPRGQKLIILFCR